MSMQQTAVSAALNHLKCVELQCLHYGVKKKKKTVFTLWWKSKQTKIAKSPFWKLDCPTGRRDQNKNLSHFFNYPLDKNNNNDDDNNNKTVKYHSWLSE